ncbi:efflux RND transporter periplasmic adaptor subunit [Rhodoplanes azumiensis]|uniref:Efflux RND transporter periplasmic adaptor subunit n=1 Tax=Rhodoplanes azumiensis TaxID=1897628 RepID=A0ABW5APF9_9BRAD
MTERFPTDRPTGADANSHTDGIPAPAGARRHWRTVTIALPLVLIAAGLAAYAAAPASAPAQSSTAVPARAEARPALTVSVAGVETRRITRSVVGTGSVAAWQPLTVAAEIAGLRIVEVTVDEGDRVTAGQVLARFEDAILQAQHAQYEAAALEAEANALNAQAELRRAQELQAGRNIAEATFQQRQMTARATEARLGMIRAQRDEVKARIAQTVVRAPTDGIVAKRTALVGTVSSVGAELFKMIRDGRVELQAQVPELDLASVAVGQPVKVVHGDTVVAGRVRLVAPVVDPATRLGTVYVALPADSGLKPGMFANAEIVTGSAEVLAVPQEALVFRDGRPAAFAVGPDGRVAVKLLDTGTRQDGWVEVRGGLGRGERIVFAGAGFLNDGDLVRIDSADARPPE